MSSTMPSSEPICPVVKETLLPTVSSRVELAVSVYVETLIEDFDWIFVI